MDQLHINLKRCYGIKKFDFVFDFVQQKAHVIYAPNGSMKSSFAKVFEDRIKDTKPQDLVNPTPDTHCHIIDDAGKELSGQNILVIGPSNPRYDSLKRQSTLLVDAKLKQEYADLLESIETEKKSFLKKVAAYSGSPKQIEELFTSAYNKSPKDFFKCLSIVKPSLADVNLVDYSEIPYKEIFNESVIKFLKKEGTNVQISEYIEEYNKLVDQSAFFKRGAFDHSNAAVISESLNKNGFFKADHKVSLSSGNGSREIIDDPEKMQALFRAEKEKILSDKNLAQRFDALDKIISNAELRSLRSILENRKEMIVKLKDIERLKMDFWTSYFKKEEKSFDALLDLYEQSAIRINEIEQKAVSQFTTWTEVVKIFKQRFDVPFNLEISNQDDVILRGAIPQLKFQHKDCVGNAHIEDTTLIKILSTGELRALYILNIIFEIKSREDDANTLIIIDDIADSFDYKNKYAIVEYLRDILNEANFRSIILTHNFDFFRTLESRLDGVNRYNSCHVIVKKEDEISLAKAKDCLDLFQKWKTDISKPALPERDKILIAAIPFVRNLVEYTKGQVAEFQMLTNTMHIKPASASITIGSIKTLYNSFWGTTIPIETDDNRSVIDVIFTLAENCLGTAEGINLENKLILSIAIRLKCEKFIISKLNDPAYVSSLASNQTAKLIGQYKRVINDEKVSILDKVNIMTPENIHFNSFMYEPILDMSDVHLQNLYRETKAL